MKKFDHWMDCPSEWRGHSAKLYAPNNLAGLLQALRKVSKVGQKLKIVSRGMNLGYGGYHSDEDTVATISLHHLDKIRSFDQEAGTIVLEPGVTKAQLLSVLVGSGYFWPGWGGPDSSSVVGHLLERGISYLGQQHSHVTGIEALTFDGRLIRCGALKNPNSRAQALGAVPPGPIRLESFFQSEKYIVTAISLRLPIVRALKTYFVEADDDQGLEKVLDWFRKTEDDGSFWLSRIHRRRRWRAIMQEAIELSIKEICPGEEPTQYFDEKRLEHELSAEWHATVICHRDHLEGQDLSQPGIRVSTVNQLCDRLRATTNIAKKNFQKRTLPIELFMEEAGHKGTMMPFGSDFTGLRFINASVPNFSAERKRFLKTTEEIFNGVPHIVEFCPVDHRLLVGLITIHHRLGDRGSVEQSEKLALKAVLKFMSIGMPPYRLDAATKAFLRKRKQQHKIKSSEDSADS